MNHITVRKPNNSDWSLIQSLVNTASDAFTPEGMQMLLSDAKQHNILVAETKKCIKGIIIWISMAAEIELLWLLVGTDVRHCGIGKELVEIVSKSAKKQRIIILKTANPCDLPSHSSLTKDNFKGNIIFFKKIGFDIVAQIPHYWGAGNSAIILVRRLWVDDG